MACTVQFVASWIIAAVRYWGHLGDLNTRRLMSLYTSIQARDCEGDGVVCFVRVPVPPMSLAPFNILSSLLRNSIYPPYPSSLTDLTCIVTFMLIALRKCDKVID